MVTGLMLLAFVDLSLYKEGQNIRKTVEQQTQLQAKKELEKAFKHTLNVVQQELQAMAEWDEVHQQFHDPSYYFFWHDERLQESGYYRPYYDGLELYKADKTLLMPGSPDKRIHFYLPDRITDTVPTIIVQNNAETHLNVFQTVTERGTDRIIGYIGITADLIPMLFKQNTFYNVNKASIYINAKQDFAYDNIMQYVDYKPVSNPVSDYLWQLIQDFIIELIILMIIISIFLSIIFNISIYKPLDTISNYLDLLKNKPKDMHPQPEGVFILKEFEELKNTLHDYHRDLQKAQKELDKQNRTVWEQARRDGLTNVYNRRAFDEAWNEAIESYEQFYTQTSFILFDCDFFKALNDTYGHEIGDEVIKLTAVTLQKTLPLGVAPYRIGGDEFAVIIQDLDPQAAMSTVQRCLLALEEAPFNSLGIREKLTFSVGLSSTLEDQSNDIVNLPRQADMAMYKAKQSLKEKIQCYHQSLDEESLTLVTSGVVNTIVNAIHNGDGVELHYQPIQSVDKKSLYYESLIRINKDGEKIYPKDIFTVVDRRRLEVELDKQVIQQVQDALQKRTIPIGTGLSINISGKTLLQPFFPDLFKQLKPYLTDYKIVLEVTENSLIDHMDYATEVLNGLRDDGFLIALDDFGSGYSSIRYLAHMPVDIIKFDMTMSRALMSEDGQTQNIIRTTAHMILTSGYELVMEGIEDEAMQSAAIETGATHLQGYLIGRPKNKPEII